MKRMTHKDHGCSFAHNTQEEEQMKENGWVEDKPKRAPRKGRKKA